MKTVPTKIIVSEFLNDIDNEERKKDCLELNILLKKWTGVEPIMWGKTIVGYGSYHYKYKSGREGDFMLTGFSPRKQNLTLYIMSGFSRYPKLMEKLGPHKTGKSCLYLKKLSDVNLEVLEELVKESVKFISNYYKD
jgi:hypothetical protein